MRHLYTTLALAISVACQGITEAPAVVTPAMAADCPLTNSIPLCGIQCLMSAGSAVGCSDVRDLQCACKSASKIRDKAAPCVTRSCGRRRGSSLESVAAAICTQCVR
ncbi:hypothetical protein C7999DRAFT_16675 [Corynascus novoguineensis]|uniref:CFEM domain-containing protein n=1 Tax=Corynascus novoguineensis TaxID=1126955 RepID=A0AAN7CNV0_9PEZI|nr:hypothetical protein C7999DRAFT_16675 [Corynascus novoguineensis]